MKKVEEETNALNNFLKFNPQNLFKKTADELCDPDHKNGLYELLCNFQNKHHENEPPIVGDEDDYDYKMFWAVQYYCERISRHFEDMSYSLEDDLSDAVGELQDILASPKECQSKIDEIWEEMQESDDPEFRKYFGIDKYDEYYNK